MALTRSENMARIRGRDTRPEVAIRSSVHRSGLRYRVNHRVNANGLWVRPDLVFTRARVAVFVDGCFWHVCPEHATWPATNATWWRDKLLRNQARDRKVDAALTDAGWRVLRVWEHEDAPSAAARIVAAVHLRNPRKTSS